MSASLTSGLSEENLVGAGEPFVIRAGHEEAVTKPFADAGGTVAYIDLRTVSTDADFLAAFHARLPLPYGGIESWDAFRDSYEEVARALPDRTMVVVRGIEELLRTDITLALRLPGQLTEARYGVGEFECLLLPVFTLSDEQG